MLAYNYFTVKLILVVLLLCKNTNLRKTFTVKASYTCISSLTVFIESKLKKDV